LLDEPTSALDYQTEHEIVLELVKHLNNGSYTGLVITHSTHLLEKLSRKLDITVIFTIEMWHYVDIKNIDCSQQITITLMI
jgi:ABC-type lipoprotein export system ATPase subunit